MNDPHDQTAADSLDSASAPEIPDDGDLTLDASGPPGANGLPDASGPPDDDVTQLASAPGQFDSPGIVVSEFSQQLKAGASPEMEAFVSRVDDTFRDEVFPVLLRKEFEYRMQAGEQPALKDWRARFPDYALQIALTHKAVKVELSGAVTERPTEPGRDPVDGSETLDDDAGDATELETPGESLGRASATTPSPRTQADLDPDLVEGRYEKRTVLGAGGMGAIWTAFDARTRRSVAFKEIRTNKVTNQQYVSRFLNEAQITAQLEHPGIVPVHDVGWQADGSPYYVMRLVSDETLARRIRKFHELKVGHADRNLASTRLLRDFINICYSLDYAHDRGIIHRDLKPQNVMIGQHGETMIIDWGLAKPFRHNQPAAEGDDASLTESKPPVPAASPAAGDSVDLDSFGPEKNPTLIVGDKSKSDTESFDPIEREHATPTIDGSVMGTLDYMAPEQAQGRLDSLDHRADIFALGAILFEILTGEAWPRGRMTTQEKIVCVAEGIVPPAREVNEDVPRPLEAICAKALARGIEDRYGTARGLINDLECWLSDKPVSVYADPWTTRCRRWVSQHRTLVAGFAAAVVVSICSLVAFGVIKAGHVADSRARAELREDEATRVQAEHDFELAIAKLNEGIGIVEEHAELSDLERHLRSRLKRVKSINARDEAIHDLVHDASSVVDRIRKSGSREGPQNFADDARDLNGALATIDDKLASLKDQLPLASLDEKEAVAHWISELETSHAHLKTTLEQNEQISLAISNFFEFIAKFDDVRYYGVHTLGRTRGDAIEETRQQAGKVLLFLARKIVPDEVNVWEDQAPADADLLASSHQMKMARAITRALSVPELSDGAFLNYLDRAQRLRLRMALFELFILLSDAEAATGSDGTATEESRAAKQALEWLVIARELQVPARCIAHRQVEYLSLLGQTEELAAVRAELRDLPPQSALDLFLLGEGERQAGRLDHAVPFYADALKRQPDNFQARYFSGWCELQLEHPAAALKEFTLCVEQRPGFPAPLLARGLTWLKLGDFEKSVADIDQALDRFPDLFLGWMAKGIALSEQGKRTAALECFDKAAALRPEDASPLINRGETFHQLGVATLQQGDPAKTEEAANHLKSAVRDLTAALEFDRTNSKVFLFRGQTLATLGQAGPALQDLQQGIALGGDPQIVVDCYRELGRVQLRTGNSSAALVSFSRALELRPDDPVTLRLRSQSLRKLGLDEDYVASLSRYLNVGQPLHEDFWNRGFAQQRLGLLREAMHDFTRLLDLGDSGYRTEALNRRGWMYLTHAQRFAEQDFDEAIRRQPANPDHHNGRGFARAMRGDHVAAIADAERAVELIRPEDEKLISIWAIYFNAATIYGQAVSRLAGDSALSDPQRAELRESYTSRAIALLDSARESADAKLHVRILQAIQQESSFEPIRNTDTFRDLVKRFAAP